MLDLSKGLITFLLGFLSLIGVDRLDPDLECAADWPMIGHLHFMPSILDLLDAARTRYSNRSHQAGERFFSLES
jgi:hypothetical protein